jgi:hypothetical protein
MDFEPLKIRNKRNIPVDEVGCKFCNKSINRIFVEHVQIEVNDAIARADM